MAPPPPPTHCRVLEINLVSAEDLAPISKNMKTYAVVWIQPDKKCSTGVNQTGGTDPTWNDKFMFKVDDKFLNSEDAKIVVEIYAAAWVKDALVGYVNVLISDIFHLRSVADAKINNSASRTVTLQIRRPSGRPQGILNMELALVDSSMRSLSQKEEEAKTNNTDHNQETENQDTNETSKPENMEKKDDKISIANDGSGSNGSGSNGSPQNKGNGSMVNGDSLCNSDVGPSASVVAAAIAKGLYVPPFTNQQAQTKEATQIREWTKKEREEEELSKKLARWRSEIPPPSSPVKSRRSGKKSRGKRRQTTRLFSCFGNAFGCEISISCGPSKKKNGTVINNKICHLSSVNDNYSSMV